VSLIDGRKEEKLAHIPKKNDGGMSHWAGLSAIHILHFALLFRRYPALLLY
jgi:hypothetical protein